MTIINIDEAVLNWTDHRKRGWMLKGQQNKVLSVVKLRTTNVIGALTNGGGEILLTVNCGNTNDHSFSLFIMKLM